MIPLQALAGLLAPIATLLARFLATRHRTGLSRRLRYHGQVRDALKDSPAAAKALDELLTSEAESFRDRELYLLRRQLDGTRLGVSIFFMLVTGAAAGLLTGWILATWGTWWAVLSITATAVIMSTLIAFTAVGFSQIYSDPQKKTE